MVEVACSHTTLARVARLLGPLLRLDRRVALTPRAELARDLAMDSLDRQSLAAELDVAFGIEVPDDDVAAWTTLADVAASVDRLCGLVAVWRIATVPNPIPPSGITFERRATVTIDRDGTC